MSMLQRWQQLAGLRAQLPCRDKQVRHVINSCVGLVSILQQCFSVE